MYPHLQHLDLGHNCLSKNGCVALVALLQCSATELRYLYISNTEINDEGIETLVPSLTSCRHLCELWIIDNPLNYNQRMAESCNHTRISQVKLECTQYY